MYIVKDGCSSNMAFFFVNGQLLRIQCLFFNKTETGNHPLQWWKSLLSLKYKWLQELPIKLDWNCDEKTSESKEKKQNKTYIAN